MYFRSCLPTNRTTPGIIRATEPAPLPPLCISPITSLTPNQIPLDGYDSVTVYGYGFAKSPFVKCLLHVTDDNGDVTAVEFPLTVMTPGSVKCDIRNYSFPSGDFAVTVEQGGSPASHGCALKNITAPLSVALRIREMALYFDGEDDYIQVTDLPDAIRSPSFNGVTFGAWFYPLSNTTCEEQPIMCFIAPCNDFSTVLQLCATYLEGVVYLQSDLFNETLPDQSSPLDNSPTNEPVRFDSRLSHPAEPYEWHFVQVIVHGRELPRPSDSGLGPAYLATLEVDNSQTDASSVGFPVPGIRYPESQFLIGGVTCGPPSPPPPR